MFKILQCFKYFKYKAWSKLQLPLPPSERSVEGVSGCVMCAFTRLARWLKADTKLWILSVTYLLFSRLMLLRGNIYIRCLNQPYHLTKLISAIFLSERRTLDKGNSVFLHVSGFPIMWRGLGMVWGERHGAGGGGGRVWVYADGGHWVPPWPKVPFTLHRWWNNQLGEILLEGLCCIRHH